MKVAHVSTFPETKCGIAFFAADLIEALPRLEHHKFALHYGVCATPNTADAADLRSSAALRKLARSISQSGCNVVSLQHEFGIWGGDHGEHIIPFLEEVSLPIVTTLHTTFAKSCATAIRIELLRSIVAKSAITVVLTARSRRTLCDLLYLPESAVRVIPHGIPNLSFVPLPQTYSAEWRGPQMISFGFFRPDKGLEVMLEAVRILNGAGIVCRYKIAGSPQPQFPEQESYFGRIESLVAELGLTEIVQLDKRFLTRTEQAHLIRAAHLAAFAYQDPIHASSGAMALALAAGRPVVCTPFEYAEAARDALGQVHVSRDFGPVAMADSLREIFEARADWAVRARSVYELTRPWTWSRVGQMFKAAFESATR